MTGRGGAREGAGRPRADVAGQERRKHSIYCTKRELVLARQFLQELREKELSAMKVRKTSTRRVDDIHIYRIAFRVEKFERHDNKGPWVWEESCDFFAPADASAMALRNLGIQAILHERSEYNYYGDRELGITPIAIWRMDTVDDLNHGGRRKVIEAETGVVVWRNERETQTFGENGISRSVTDSLWHDIHVEREKARKRWKAIEKADDARTLQALLADADATRE